MLARKQYGVVHVQNCFPMISPSVFHAANPRGVLHILILRDYRLVCPAGTLFRNQTICDSCMGKAAPWPAALHACYRDSRAASGVAAAMLTSHNALGTWRKKVDRYIAVSDFVRAKFVEAGFSS